MAAVCIELREYFTHFSDTTGTPENNRNASMEAYNDCPRLSTSVQKCAARKVGAETRVRVQLFTGDQCSQAISATAQGRGRYEGHQSMFQRVEITSEHFRVSGTDSAGSQSCGS